MTKQNNKLPKFFNYKEEDTDNGYETIQDFFLSWTLRCSQEKYQEINKGINEYARKIVYILIYGNNKNEKFYFKNKFPNDFKVTNVKTIRQDGYIDLVAELTIEEGNEKIKYVFSIENKWYTETSKYQLQKSREYIENKYDNKEYEIINLLIFCDDEYNIEQMKLANDNEYKCLSIEDLKYYAGIKSDNEDGDITGNELFDEYWFRF